MRYELVMSAKATPIRHWIQLFLFGIKAEAEKTKIIICIFGFNESNETQFHWPPRLNGKKIDFPFFLHENFSLATTQSGKIEWKILNLKRHRPLFILHFYSKQIDAMLRSMHCQRNKCDSTTRSQNDLNKSDE